MTEPQTDEKTYTLELTGAHLDRVLNSFNAQKLRIKKYIQEAREQGKSREEAHWTQLQADADKTAKLIRDQTGRMDPRDR